MGERVGREAPTPWFTEWEALAAVIGKGHAPYSDEGRTAIAALRQKMEGLGMMRVAIDRTITLSMDRGMARRVRPTLDINGQRRIAMQKARQPSETTWGQQPTNYDPLLVPKPRVGRPPGTPNKKKKIVPKRIGRPAGRKEGSPMEKFEWAEDVVGLKALQCSWLSGPDKDGDGLMIGIFYINGTDQPYQVYKVKRAVGMQPVSETIGTPMPTQPEAVAQFYAPTVEVFKGAR